MLRGEGRERLYRALRSVLSSGAAVVSLVESELVQLITVLLRVSSRK